MKRLSAVYVTFLLLTACASLGLEPAKDFNDRLAYAVAQNAGLRLAAANSLNAKEIEVTDAQFVLKTTDEARTVLDAARVASEAGDISTAEGRLSVVAAVTANLQTYLRSRSQK